MLLDKRITDLFSSSCIYKCPIKQKRDTVLKISRGRRNKRIVENTFSPNTWEIKIKGFQKTDVFNRREHARHMWLKKPLNFVWVILTNCIFLKHVSQIFRFFLKGVEALHNSQLSLRCLQSLYLCETMSGKQKNHYQMPKLLGCPLWLQPFLLQPWEAKIEISYSNLSSHGVYFRIICSEAVQKLSFLN